MAIDVGSSCEDRLSGTTGPITVVDKNNPANATGLIFQICIYSYTAALTSVEVAAFSASGNDLTSRGYTSLANTGVGSTTYTAPGDFTPFEIRSGDYIGIYFDNGALRMSLSGAGLWDLAGDNIPCVSESFASQADRTISLYATGYQLGQINIGDSWKDIQNIKINVGDDWKQLVDGKINIGDVWKDILH